jgi:hypothetical protein
VCHFYLDERIVGDGAAHAINRACDRDILFSNAYPVASWWSVIMVMREGFAAAISVAFASLGLAAAMSQFIVW